MTEHASNEPPLAPIENMQELAAWLETRGISAQKQAARGKAGKAGRPPAGPIARAGAIPAIEVPTLSDDARAHAASAGDVAAETVRLPPGEGHRSRAPKAAKLDGPQTVSDPRLSNPRVRGSVPEVAASDTLAAPGELAGLLKEVEAADPGLAAARGGPKRPERPDRPSRSDRMRDDQGPTDPEVTGIMRSTPGKQATRRSGAAGERNQTPVMPDKTRQPRGSARELRFDAAPMWRRLLATVIDASVVVALIVLPLRAGWFGEVASNIRIWEPDDIGRALFGGHLTVPLILGALLILVLGCVPHALAGRTLGKLVTGLMLVNSWNGTQPGWPQVILRQFIGLATTTCGFASYLWFIVDRRSSALHDRLAGTTCVVANSRVVTATRDPMAT